MEQGGASTGAHAPAGAAGPVLVAGRYRLLDELARGGVGQVHRAHDESMDRQVALKRILPRLAENRRVTMLFEREFQTLAQLQHPHIIEVYDYGVDDGGPYYTMELLDGNDLNELAPIPHTEACRYLRDVASSLALLHSRRLLHRDLSPRNVRRLSSGHCKLLDFGTMASFGIPDEIVGTPPMVAPETLRGLPLDQRADLYSLGALAYRVLTKRYAYHARRIEELPQTWQTRPELPSRIIAGIPPELDELVMSLLSLDPSLRPASASEVIERLNSIANLDPDPNAVQVAHAYLLHPRLIGRKRHIERIQQAFARAREGRGATLVIEGNPGVGKTRLLDEASLHAQLSGALVLRVDGRSHRGPMGVASAMGRALVHAAPQPAREAAMPYGALLQDVIPELEPTEASNPMVVIAPARRRAQLQEAMLQWMLSVSRWQPIAVLVDDLHRVDEASASLLATLAVRARAHNLVVITTRRLAGAVTAPQAVQALVAEARRIRLHRLRREYTLELISTLLGQVPNVEPLAHWIHDVTTGTTTQIMALCEHLVDQGHVRYVEGTWVIPADLPTDDLPVSLAATMSARAAALSPDARKLAEALSVRRGRLPLALCVALADAGTDREVFRLLDELVARGVLQASGHGYSFAQEALRETLLAELEPKRGRALHRKLGEALLAQDNRPETQMEAGWHLLRAGDEERGADLLADAAPRMATRGGAMTTAIPALEAALRVYRERWRSPADQLQVMTTLVLTSDRGACARHADETFDGLVRYSGLHTAMRLSPLFGKRLAVGIGLGLAMLGRLLTPAQRRGPRPMDALLALFRVVFGLIPVRAAVLDVEGVRRMLPPLATLAPINTLSRVSYLLLQGAFASIQGRFDDARTHALEASALMEARRGPEPVDAAASRGLRALAIITRSMAEARTSLSSDKLLALFQEIEALRDDPAMKGKPQIGTAGGVSNEELTGSVAQIRLAYHALRGETGLAERHQDLMTVYGLQSGLKWVYDVWRILLRGLASSLATDLAGTRRCIEQLRDVVAELPHLHSYQALMEAALKSRLGRPAEAIPALERCVEQMPAGQHAGWDSAVNALAEARLAIGDTANAVRELRAAVELFGEEPAADLRRVVLRSRLALALALDGQADEAAALIDRLVQVCEGCDHPLALGQVREVAALVAWKRGDRRAFEAHAEQMQRWYGATRNSALLSRAQRVFQIADQRDAREQDPGDGELDVITRMNTGGAADGIGVILAACADDEERARMALELVLEQSTGTAGHLYRWHADRLELAASIESPEPEDDLERLMHRQVHAYLHNGSAPPVDRDDDQRTGSTVVTIDANHERYATLLLPLDPQDERRVAGVVAIKVGDAVLQPVRQRFLRALAAGLDDA